MTFHARARIIVTRAWRMEGGELVDCEACSRASLLRRRERRHGTDLSVLPPAGASRRPGGDSDPDVPPDRAPRGRKALLPGLRLTGALRGADGRAPRGRIRSGPAFRPRPRSTGASPGGPRAPRGAYVRRRLPGSGRERLPDPAAAPAAGNLLPRRRIGRSAGPPAASVPAGHGRPGGRARIGLAAARVGGDRDDSRRRDRHRLAWPVAPVSRHDEP